MMTMMMMMSLMSMSKMMMMMMTTMAMIRLHGDVKDVGQPDGGAYLSKVIR